MRNRTKMLLMAMGLGLVFGFTASATLDRDYEDASQTLEWVIADDGGFTWSDILWNENAGDTGTDDGSMRLGAGGNEGGGTDDDVWFRWDLDDTYDFWQGGSPATTWKVDPWSPASLNLVRIRFLDASDTVVASADFTDLSSSGYRTLDLGAIFDGDETHVTTIQVMIRRKINLSSNPSAIIMVDDFTSNASLSVPLGPSTILSLSHVAGDVFEMVVDCPAPAISYPKVSIDLSDGLWDDVAHSTNSSGPFATNHLGIAGTNTIYVESSTDAAFFGIGEQ